MKSACVESPEKRHHPFPMRMRALGRSNMSTKRLKRKGLNKPRTTESGVLVLESSYHISRLSDRKIQGLDNSVLIIIMESLAVTMNQLKEGLLRKESSVRKLSGELAEEISRESSLIRNLEHQIQQLK